MEEKEFLHETITKDLDKKEKSGLNEFMESSFEKELRKSKLTKKKEKIYTHKQRKTAMFVVMLSFLVLIIGALAIYFIIISPTFIFKPSIPKPDFDGAIDSKHLQYIVNELGAYKLHFSPIDGKGAQFEIDLQDLQKKYMITVENGKPTVMKAEAPYP